MPSWLSTRERDAVSRDKQMHRYQDGIDATVTTSLLNLEGS